MAGGEHQQRPPRGGGGGGVNRVAIYLFVILLAFTGVTVLQNHIYLNADNITTPTSSISGQELRDRFTQQQQAIAAPPKAVQAADSAVVEPKAATSLRDDPEHLAGLSCERFGGPPLALAQEMVYWQDHPEDATHMSPFHRHHPHRNKGEGAKTDADDDTADDIEYMTFEPDQGGFNNIRMALETQIGLAIAMGRTLVLPPEQEFYLLKQKGGQQQRTHFSFDHFFHMEAIHEEHAGLDIIRMEEFLQSVAMKGLLKDAKTGQTSYPPDRRTNWDGASKDEIRQLFDWIRDVSYMAVWSPDKCLAAFPASAARAHVNQLLELEQQIQANPPHYEDYIGKPVAVDAPALDRLKENWAGREKLCIYDEEMQGSRLVHFPSNQKLGSRLLVHWYAFLFFQDWKTDLWMKRFVRDHIRYVDEIQCAAARIVQAVRERARQRDPTNAAGEFDSFHVRRGDFQYKKTRVSAEEILRQAQKKLTDGATVYIGTDERDKSFFDPLKKHYDVVFLDDFQKELGNINSNYFGMIDQLIASRGRIFFGCWFSTFTGYIMRLRGYHSDKEKVPGYKDGVVPNSWFYVLEDRFDHMQTFYPVKKSFYAREFPTSWRLIDTVDGAP